VNQDEFETRVLELWMKTLIPLTLAHLQYHTGVKRQKLKSLLDDLVLEGVLEMDADDDGEVVWKVPGALRPSDGPTSFAEFERRETIRADARRKVRTRSEGKSRRDDHYGLGAAGQALALAGEAKKALDRPRVEGEKSLIASAGLSLLGPIGWLYAGSLKEAVPATIAQLLIAAIVPSFLLMPVLLVALPLSALAGLVYAWQYNKKGERTTIFLGDGKSTETE
jgi:hypothetical protein